MKINTDIASLKVRNRLRQINRGEEDSLAKLASSDRIYRAGMDPSGSAISTKMLASTRSYARAVRNANDAVSYIQVAEGSLNQISDMAIRLRELAIGAASDTLGPSERQIANLEFSQTKDEIQRQIDVARFNGRRLFKSGDRYELQSGIHASKNDRLQYDASDLVTSLSQMGISGSTLATKDSARESIGELEDMLNQVAKSRAILGSFQERFISTAQNLEESKLNHEASRSRIRDTDYASEVAERVKFDIQKSANTANLVRAHETSQSAFDILKTGLF
jgi:flagellin